MPCRQLKILAIALLSDETKPDEFYCKRTRVLSRLFFTAGSSDSSSISPRLS